jgi:hypothetical protein
MVLSFPRFTFFEKIQHLKQSSFPLNKPSLLNGLHHSLILLSLKNQRPNQSNFLLNKPSLLNGLHYSTILLFLKNSAPQKIKLSA